MGIRIDNATALSVVTLELDSRGRESYEEEALFMGVTGEGDDRRAVFVSRKYDGEPYQWEAYRMEGRWCYGASGDTLRIVSVDKVINTHALT